MFVLLLSIYIASTFGPALVIGYGFVIQTVPNTKKDYKFGKLMILVGTVNALLNIVCGSLAFRTNYETDPNLALIFMSICLMWDLVYIVIYSYIRKWLTRAANRVKPILDPLIF